MNKEQDLLKEKGFKVTPTRLLILNAFSAGCKPINAEDIFSSLKKTKINLVTIYRTLSSFEEKGILKHVDLHKGSMYYERAEHHHHHIVCKGCGLIESLGDCNEKGLSKNALKKSSKFKVIDQHSLEFFGVCRKCSV